MKKALPHFLYFCILTSLFTFSEAYSQGYPAIKNYSKITSDHSIGWSLIQDNRGVMYLGMQLGIIEFSNLHKSWFIKNPNSSTTRSMAIDSNGIIYVGAQREFGFLKPDRNGLMEYESLLPKLEVRDRNFTEVSKVHNTKDGICFQTFEGLYFYKSGKFKIVRPSTSFHFSFYLNNVFYVLERGIGLEIYSNGNLQLIPRGDEFANDRIYSILPYSENQLLITTRERGLFIYTIGDKLGNPVKPFAKEASRFLCENQVYDAVSINNQFVFATIRGGILIMDTDENRIRIFDNTNLLKENKVNALYVDNNKDLWIAQDNYIARIELNSPYLILNENSGLNGNISALTKFENKIYVATNYGLYMLDKDSTDELSNSKFRQFDLKTECFNFLKAKFKNVEKLFVVSRLGIYEVRGTRLVPILKDYCFYAYQSKYNENKIYVGLKNGIVLLIKNGEEWKVKYPSDNLKDEIKSISEDKFGNLWIAGYNDGIYKINAANNELISSLDKSDLFEHFDTLNGLPSNDMNKVFSFEGDVLFGTLNGFYKFDPKNKIFNVEESFSNALSDRSAPQIYDLFEEKNDHYTAIIHDQVLGNELIKWRKVNGKFENLFEKTFKRLHEGDLISSYSDGSSQLLIGSSLGVLNLDLKSKATYNSKFNVLLKSVIIGQDSVIFSGTFYQKKWKDGDTLFCPIDSQIKEFIPKIDYALNSVSFKFDCSFYEVASFNTFTCYLEGYETTWRPWFSDGKISYSNLHEGTYRLHLKAKNIYDTESDEKVYEFKILAPWYRTITAYFLYTILFSGFVYLLVQLSVRRLKAAKILLENTVKERTTEIVKQNVEIQKQKDIVEIKNKDITDSINYAKRIQETILPPEAEIKKLLPDSFILFLPKDILSGDFYWMDEIESKVLVAAVDCTGHGVPGALMSIVGNNILNQSINEHRISKPSAILDELNKGVTYTLRQKNEESKVKDGMDIVLLAIDFKNRRLEFAGANNPLYLIRNGSLTEIKGNKFPIGIYIGEEQKHFTNQEIDLEVGDALYLFTDGYADQFGGPLGKKFKYNQFKETLLKIQPYPLNQQREELLKTISNWQGNAEQVDDILVIGIKIA